MNEFYNAAKTVEPMQKNVDEKTIELKDASEKLAIVQEKVKKLQEELDIVMGEKEKAEKELNDAVTNETNCKEKRSNNAQNPPVTTLFRDNLIIFYAFMFAYVRYLSLVNLMQLECHSHTPILVKLRTRF